MRDKRDSGARSRRRAAPLTALAMTAAAMVGLVAVPSAASAAPTVHAASVCGYHLGPVISSGAAGSLGFIVDLVPNDPAQNCSVSVTASGVLAEPGGGLPGNVSGNPATKTFTAVFSPSLQPPTATFFWSPHCADPSGNITFTAVIAGMQVSAHDSPSSCSAGFGGSSTLSTLILGQSAAFVGMARTTSGHGYWLVQADGTVSAHGDAVNYGSMAHPAKPIVGMARTVTGNGYWLVASDGGIFSFGDAVFYGSAGGLPLVKPVVGMAVTATGHGYWLVASDGGIFSYGDAVFYGSAGGLPLIKPVVGMATTSNGHGYWLVASDGGIFSYGNATFYGSAGGLPLVSPVTGLAVNQAGNGYWLVASDGGIFSYSSAFHGSAGGTALTSPVDGMVATPVAGYWLFGTDGTVLPFGDGVVYP